VCVCKYVYLVVVLLYYYVLIRLSIIDYRSLLEIRRHASPEYWCWDCLIDYFDGLSFDDILSIFLDGRVVCVPFFEINVNVAIMNFAILFFACAATTAFIIWQCKLFGLDDEFFYLAELSFIDDIG